VQVIRKSSRSQGHEISPQSDASPMTPHGHHSSRRLVDHASSDIESLSTSSRSRNLSNHLRSFQTPSYQPNAPVSRDQGMRTPSSRTKSPSSQSQRSSTPTSSPTKSPSTARHQRSRTPSSRAKSPTSQSQQAQHTPTSRTKSPSSHRVNEPSIRRGLVPQAEVTKHAHPPLRQSARRAPRAEVITSKPLSFP
jgi:hypothetical protein